MEFNQLQGLGPKTIKALKFIGVSSVAEFMETDPYELYIRLKQQVPGTSLNALYGIMGAQEETDWKIIARERKTEILMRLEDLGWAPN